MDIEEVRKTAASVPPYKPSDVNLFVGFPSLVDTFDKTEIECAAFYIVRTLAVKGDDWRPLRWTDIAEVIKESIAKIESHLPPEFAPHVSKEDLYLNDMAKNPFARPDFHKLVSKGFAKWLGEECDKNRPIELTDLGFERLQRWVRR